MDLLKSVRLSVFFLVIGFQRENRVVVTVNWLSFQWRFVGFDVISNKAREIVRDATGDARLLIFLPMEAS